MIYIKALSVPSKEPDLRYTGLESIKISTMLSLHVNSAKSPYRLILESQSRSSQNQVIHSRNWLVTSALMQDWTTSSLSTVTLIDLTSSSWVTIPLPFAY